MSRAAVAVALALAACQSGPSDIGSSTSHDAVVHVYNQEFQFTQPRACDVLLQRRATDERARIVEYDAKVAGRQASIVYSVVANDPLPLQVGLFAARGQTLFKITADAHTLIVGGPDGSTLRSIDNYDGPPAGAVVHGTAAFDPGDGLTLLGCALADRTVLGSVPAFLRNLASGGAVTGDPDVGTSSSNAAPLLPNWNGAVSLLGAFWLMSACLDATGWQCGCWGPPDPVVGPVGGSSCP